MALFSRRKNYFRVWRFEFYKIKFKRKSAKPELSYYKGVCGCRLLSLWYYGVTLLGKGDCYKAEQ